jgi:putative endonuclease
LYFRLWWKYKIGISREVVNYFVYILKSEKNSCYYIGQTENIFKRLEEHNLGKSKSTRRYIPWKLVYREIYDTRSDAFKREQELKRIKKRSSIEKLIAG